MEEAEITIKIPLDLKKRLERSDIDVNQAVSNVIQKIIEDNSILDDISEIHLERKDLNTIRASDIPPGSFIRVPGLMPGAARTSIIARPRNTSPRA
jgi:hypothetical protein